LHFLGFLWWNRYFSMRYSEKNKKIPLRSDSPPELCAGRRNAFCPALPIQPLWPTPSIR
jgi:hypothetical protein